MPIDLTMILALIAIGFIAGTAGGLVGLGGSIVMIPALTLLLRQDQHLAQASAMIVNVFIAVPSLIWHRRAGTVRWDIVGRALPFGLVTIMLGVLLGNSVDGELLKKIFGLFLLYVM
ncbi:MAG: sulfite exporter TauE/SafE family protein, partial [Planctomycetota bacterium]